MSSDSEFSPIFGVVLMKILWRTMTLKKALTRKLTSHIVSRDVLSARFKKPFMREK